MIQEIAPHRFDNSYRPAPPKGDDCVLYFENRSCLLREADGRIYFPTVAEVEERCFSGTERKGEAAYIYLFRIEIGRAHV